jgi:hypothetical protein
MSGLIIGIFVLGYAAIALEHTIKLNKAASALITGVLFWVVYIASMPDKHVINEQLTGHLGELSGIKIYITNFFRLNTKIDFRYLNTAVVEEFHKQ